ncbi:MAG: anti-sigma factor, partial [Allomuricauda sp.]
MDTKAYITSGILELYVAGQLSEKENQEVANYANQYPEIKAEIIEIEKAILDLSAALAPKNVPSFDSIKNRLDGASETKIISLDSKKRSWIPYVGWAASVIFAVGLAYMYNQNQELSSEIKIAETEMRQMELQIAEANNSLEKSKQLLSTLRDKNVTVIPLGGQ